MRLQTNEEFLRILKSKNPNVITLSEYKNDKSKIKCKCKICGYEWEDSATHLKQGRSCSQCKKKLRQQKTGQEFIQKANKIHNNKYDYSKFVYINAQTKGIIVCPIHGEFLQTPNSHLNGRGCPKCAGNNYKRDKEEFIDRAKKVHGSKYDYSKVEYKTCKDHVCIICPKHGEFWQTPDHHLQGDGCPKCILASQTILFQKLQETFPKLKILFEVNKDIIPWIGNQRIDIYIPKYNIAIEYNGIQHYVPVEHFGGKVGFEETLRRDTIKREKCKVNNCILFEVKYDYSDIDYNNLVQDINKIISQCHKL